MTSVLHHRPIVESAPALAVADATWHSEDDTAAWARRLATQPQLANAYITLHGDLAPFAELLHLGQWLHVGKNATMGLGGYRLTAS